MKVALVTGATSGFGKAIATEFVNNNYTVFGFGRNIPTDENKGIKYIRMDITDEKAINEGLETVFSQVKKLMCW